jgi:hypothetical protein
MRYTFLILGTYHPDTLHLREQGCGDPWLFFEAKKGPRAKKFGKHSSKAFGFSYCTANSRSPALFEAVTWSYNQLQEPDLSYFSTHLHHLQNSSLNDGMTEI